MVQSQFIYQEKIKEFYENWKVEGLSLFGSILRNDFHANSDVDILIRLSDYSNIGLHEWFEMIEELETIYGQKVDLVDKGGLKNPFRRSMILNFRLIIYE